MQILNQESYMDKSDWRRGEWDDEPDRMEWRSNTEPSFPCLIVRNGGGALCGYVGVGKNHPCYQKDYSEPEVEVHGGLTYANKCQEGGKICHTPLENESDDIWWLGFDCSHLGDEWPADNYLTREVRHYKNIAYVMTQVHNLAKQLADKVK